jgi:hypothetical protein
MGRDRVPNADGFEMPVSEPCLGGNHSLPPRLYWCDGFQEKRVLFSYHAALCLQNVYNAE